LADQRGVVGGVEVLPFGFLIFVAFALVLANAWAVVDAKLAVESAAREAGRAYVEAHDPATAWSASERAARDAMSGAGRDPSRLSLHVEGGPYERCQVVEHVTSYEVAGLTIPFIGSFGSGVTVSGRHRSVIDPFASGQGRTNDCGI
jgi:hypothetical protein